MRVLFSSARRPLQIDVIGRSGAGTRRLLDTAGAEVVELSLDSGQAVSPPPVECDVIVTCAEGAVSLYLTSSDAPATRQDLVPGDMALIEAHTACRIQSRRVSVLLVSKPLGPRWVVDGGPCG